MKEKLPKIFANKINKKLENNNTVYTTNEKERDESTKDVTNIIKEELYNESIEQKINKILKSNKYIYKIPVIIETNEKKIETNIIGKNQTKIININNEFIKIKDIKKIEAKENTK